MRIRKYSFADKAACRDICLRCARGLKDGDGYREANYALYCDSFSSSQQAESQKAVLAFQGIVATVVQNQDGTYSLRIGPFASDDEARNTFYSLNERGVVQKCALY